MILSNEAKQFILSKFPSFKLCYETLVHNKVNFTDMNTFQVAIPKGPKCFLWFSLYNSNPYCFLIERGRERDTIANIEIIGCSFSHTLIGSILSGTIVNYKFKKFIVVDDIYYYKSRNINSFMEPIDRIKLLGGLFIDKQIKNIIELKIQIMLAPFSITSVKEYIDSSEIPFYCIQYRKTRGIPFCNLLLKKRDNNVLQSINVEKLVTFNVIAEQQNDIYSLYSADGVEIGKACVPSYEDSKRLNSLFRNIKENRNLDSLEESDDDDEFENVSLDKFIINKDKVLKMDCVYVQKFKKWRPIKLNDGGNVVHSKQLMSML
jgi:hypothetical protein